MKDIVIHAGIRLNTWILDRSVTALLSVPLSAREQAVGDILITFSTLKRVSHYIWGTTRA
jgi:hypothetical protein